MVWIKQFGTEGLDIVSGAALSVEHIFLTGTTKGQACALHIKMAIRTFFIV
jgi:hypothetical protein